MQQLLTAAHFLGGVLMVFALGFLPPLGWSYATRDGMQLAFGGTALGTLLAGALLWGVTRPFRRELQPKDGCLLIVLVWVCTAALASVPLQIGVPGLSFTDAYFESMAALTTTASSVMPSVERLPQSINLWRHALQWYGGMAVIVMSVAILPMLGVGGLQLIRADTPGPMKEGKLGARMLQTFRHLGVLYVVVTAACMVALRWAGMDWFDALCHAFSTLSLGGFTTREAGIAAFDSLRVELVLMAFMMFGALNFGTHFVALRQRSVQGYLRDTEVMSIWLVVIASAAMLAFYLVRVDVYPDYVEALRRAGFATVSMATTAGFVGEGHGTWPIFPATWLLLLCTIASSAGSTGGGIRMIRALVLVKQAGHELVRMVHPRAVTPLRISGQAVDTRVVFAVLGYMLLFGATVVVLTFALMATGLDFESALSGVVSSVSNTGPGLAALAPGIGYRPLDDLQVWMCTVAMLAGRVELLALYVLFTPQFWRK